MLSWSIRCLFRGLLFGLLSLCAGCGATGLEWVSEAQLESAQQPRLAAVSESTASEPISRAIPAPAEPHASEARPRLNRSITLGEIDAAAVTRADTGPASASGPSVSVNSYNQINVVTPAFGYGNFGYWGAGRSFSPGREAAASSRPSSPDPQPGQNWPAIADHGPSFPYGSAPASPWTRTP